MYPAANMPEFDNALSPVHYRPHLEYNPGADIERYTVLLKDGETTATIYPIRQPLDLPPGLLGFLCDEFNMEVERGDTLPFFDALHVDAFQNYWFGAFAGVMVLGDAAVLDGPKQWEKECLGTFFVKPNYPGRASHISTAGFLVNAGIRGKGIGRTLTDCFLQWAPRLGYTYCVFNLVFELNVAARRIWESLNFKRIGRVKLAGILKGHDTAVDGIIYGRELVAISDQLLGAYRFDKIKFYLETGKYPAMADRLEKLRLRSLALHYRLEGGKLMLRDKEVVSDPVRQLQICTETHLLNHAGINKTTSTITEKYHWTRIKDTVVAAIKNCDTCKEAFKEQDLLKLKHVQRKMLQSMPAPKKGMEMGPGYDLGLDDGLMAAVEAAEKRNRPQLYALVAAAATDQEYFQEYPHAYTNKYTKRREVPVDPDVSAFDHNVRDEIDIARALIELNEETENDKDKDMFLVAGDR